MALDSERAQRLAMDALEVAIRSGERRFSEILRVANRLLSHERRWFRFGLGRHQAIWLLQRLKREGRIEYKDRKWTISPSKPKVYYKYPSVAMEVSESVGRERAVPRHDTDHPAPTSVQPRS